MKLKCKMKFIVHVIEQLFTYYSAAVGVSFHSKNRL